VLQRLNDHKAAQECNQAFLVAHPESVAAKRIRAAALGPAETLKVMSQLYSEEPGNDYRANQYANQLVAMGQYEEVLNVIRSAHPQLLSEKPIVNGETTWPAAMAIVALQKTGRVEQAEKLLDAFERGIADIRLIAGPGFTHGLENVEIAALRGDTDLALALLRKAIDQGWRFIWDFLPYYQSFSSIHEEPQYLEMMDEIRADIDKQRARYHATKDQPLF
jgi:tetratricopeptide (TPR) repeat protein